MVTPSFEFEGVKITYDPRLETGDSMTMKPYPTWVCHDCGMTHTTKIPWMSTFHHARCEVCGKWAELTQPRDYGYPEFPGHEKP